MNYSFLPKKIIEKHPIYNNDYTCPKCGSKDSSSFTNTYGCPRDCMKCGNQYKLKIIGYRDVIVEKNVN
jgi:transcription elongation factor Elf1